MALGKPTIIRSTETKAVTFSIPGPSVGLVSATLPKTGRSYTAPPSQVWMHEVGRAARFHLGRDLITSKISLNIACYVGPDTDINDEFPDLPSVFAGIVVALEHQDFGLIKNGGQVSDVSMSKIPADSHSTLITIVVLQKEI